MMAQELETPLVSRRLGEYLDCPAESIEAALSGDTPEGDGIVLGRIGERLLAAGLISLDDLLVAIEAQRKDRLRQCVLFDDLPEPDLVELSAVFQEITVSKGETFITQDEKDRNLYVLASGRLEVYRVDDDGREIKLATVFPGEPAGEMGYFSESVRTASVRAVETAQLLRASYTDLTDCFETLPNVARAFMDVVTRRLRRTNLLYQEGEHRRRRGVESLSHLNEYLGLSDVYRLGQGLDGLFERLVRTASRLTDAERASLFLVDQSSGEIWSKVAERSEIREIRVPMDSGIVGWVAKHGHLVNIPDAYEDPRFNRDVDKRTGFRTTSLLCAPVRDLKDRVVGAVQVMNKNTGLFNDNDEGLLRGFADQAMVFLDNFQLYQTVVQSNQRMSMMLDLATAIGSARDLRELMVIMARKIAEQLRCEYVALYQLDTKSRDLWNANEGGAGAVRRVAIAKGLLGRVARSGETVNVPDAYELPDFDPAIDQPTRERARSALYVPVRGEQNTILGVIQALNGIEGPFSADDVELASAVAAQLGLSALLNAPR
jgi:GAF domain-containing protein